LAKRLIDSAAEAGADAVKFQTFKAEQVAAPTAPKAAYQLQTTATSESQLDMLRRLELAPEAYQELQAYCQQCGVFFLSTPFDKESADLLENLVAWQSSIDRLIQVDSPSRNSLWFEEKESPYGQISCYPHG
jgi:N,N'-diacetyllegionaminate synthase